MASLLCMIAIFWFSSQNAEQSGEMSLSLTHRIFGTIGGWVGVDEIEPFIDILDMLVRKSAHLVIYGILGFCVSNTIMQITENKRYIFWISLVWCSFYAATDELHQHFVPGRAGMWQDWVLDTVGALIGIGAAFFISSLIYKYREKKNKS